MKERGIIMSAPMVKALLDGSKTQTRRIVKPQPDAESVMHCNFGHGWSEALRCPYGVAGDRLWVRETHAFHVCHDKSKSIAKCGSQGDLVVYRDESSNHPYSAHMRGKWRPSIFMPRWASRITLEITGVRVERVAAISIEDCLAEGIHPEGSVDTVGMYAKLWDELHGAGSWQLNPWVWVLAFQRASP